MLEIIAPTSGVRLALLPLCPSPVSLFVLWLNLPKRVSRRRLTSEPVFSAFLSYLRLSVYMAVVSIAIVLSFHLKSQPSHFELRMAKPLGVIFWVLAVCCLLLGLGNYISERILSCSSHLLWRVGPSALTGQRL